MCTDIPFLANNYIFQNLAALTSLRKLFVYKYQLKVPLVVYSESLMELDLDVEDFDEDGERVSFRSVFCADHLVLGGVRN